MQDRALQCAGAVFGDPFERGLLPRLDVLWAVGIEFFGHGAFASPGGLVRGDAVGYGGLAGEHLIEVQALGVDMGFSAALAQQLRTHAAQGVDFERLEVHDDEHAREHAGLRGRPGPPTKGSARPFTPLTGPEGSCNGAAPPPLTPWRFSPSYRIH